MQRRKFPMRGMIAGFLSDRRGSAAVEFAIVCPIALMITLGGLEMGRAIWAQTSINHAVHETVRFASVRGAASPATASQGDLETMAQNIADLDPSITTATASWAPDNIPGSVVTVEMTHTFTPMVTLIDFVTINLDASASMTIVR